MRLHTVLLGPIFARRPIHHPHASPLVVAVPPAAVYDGSFNPIMTLRATDFHIATG